VWHEVLVQHALRALVVELGSLFLLVRVLFGNGLVRPLVGDEMRAADLTAGRPVFTVQQRARNAHLIRHAFGVECLFDLGQGCEQWSHSQPRCFVAEVHVRAEPADREDTWHRRGIGARREELEARRFQLGQQRMGKLGEREVPPRSSKPILHGSTLSGRRTICFRSSGFMAAHASLFSDGCGIPSTSALPANRAAPR